MKDSQSWSHTSTRKTAGTFLKHFLPVFSKAALEKRNRKKKNGSCKALGVIHRQKKNSNC